MSELADLGFCASNGMGLTALPFSEIQAWDQMTGRTLTPWEAHVLRLMSRAFVGGYHADHPPYDPVTVKKLILSGKLLGG